MFPRLAKATFLQDLISRSLAMFPTIALHNIEKYVAIKKSLYLNALDGVDGDYLEFGVFTGSSMSAAIRFGRNVSPTSYVTRFFGFDSFKGFGELTAEEKGHPSFRDVNFITDLTRVRKRLEALVSDKSRVTLIDGFFDDTLNGKAPHEYGISRAGVVLVDCDTYTAADHVFRFVESILQEGTILIVDDFYCFKGNPRLGTRGAFQQLLARCEKWQFDRIFEYGCGGVAYIVVDPGANHVSA